MTLAESVTLATDLGLGVLSALCAQRLFRISVPSRRIATRTWGAALLATAGAAILGGLVHGFEPELGESGHRLLWTATLYLIGLASACMLAASVRTALRDPLRRTLLVLTWIKFAAFAWWITGHPMFRYVIYDYGSAMLLVLLLQAWGSYRWREQSTSWIVAGVLVSFIAAGVQVIGYDPHRYFDHNDVYHLIQMGGVVFFYQGARRIKPR